MATCWSSWPNGRCSGRILDGDAGRTALVLVGGLGTRLRAVTGDMPKPMAPIAGQPFLAYLLRYLLRSGIRRAVLCVGHGADVIQAHFGSGEDFGLALTYSVEETLAGTGGALRLAGSLVKDFPVLTLNGDSFTQVDLPAMRRFHETRGARLTMALTPVPDAGRFGALQADPETGEIRAFGEKSRSGPGLINAGVYFIEHDVVNEIGDGVVSLERDVMPRWIGRGLYGFVAEGFFVDIGVPDSYQRLASDPATFLAAVSSGRPES